VGLKQGVERGRASRGPEPVHDEGNRQGSENRKRDIDHSAQDIRSEHEQGPAWVADQSGEQERSEDGADPDCAEQESVAAGVEVEVVAGEHHQ